MQGNVDRTLSYSPMSPELRLPSHDRSHSHSHSRSAHSPRSHSSHSGAHTPRAVAPLSQSPRTGGGGGGGGGGSNTGSRPPSRTHPYGGGDPSIPRPRPPPGPSRSPNPPESLPAAFDDLAASSPQQSSSSMQRGHYQHQPQHIAHASSPSSHYQRSSSNSSTHSLHKQHSAHFSHPSHSLHPGGGGGGGGGEHSRSSRSNRRSKRRSASRHNSSSGSNADQYTHRAEKYAAAGGGGGSGGGSGSSRNLNSSGSGSNAYRDRDKHQSPDRRISMGDRDRDQPPQQQSYSRDSSPRVTSPLQAYGSLGNIPIHGTVPRNRGIPSRGSRPPLGDGHRYQQRGGGGGGQHRTGHRPSSSIAGALASKSASFVQHQRTGSGGGGGRRSPNRSVNRPPASFPDNYNEPGLMAPSAGGARRSGSPNASPRRSSTGQSDNPVVSLNEFFLNEGRASPRRSPRNDTAAAILDPDDALNSLLSEDPATVDTYQPATAPTSNTSSNKMTAPTTPSSWSVDSHSHSPRSRGVNYAEGHLALAAHGGGGDEPPYSSSSNNSQHTSPRPRHRSSNNAHTPKSPEVRSAASPRHAAHPYDDHQQPHQQQPSASLLVATDPSLPAPGYWFCPQRQCGERNHWHNVVCGRCGTRFPEADFRVEELGRLLVKIRGEYIPHRNGVDQRKLKSQLEREGTVFFNELVSVNLNYSASQLVRPSGLWDFKALKKSLYNEDPGSWCPSTKCLTKRETCEGVLAQYCGSCGAVYLANVTPAAVASAILHRSGSGSGAHTLSHASLQRPDHRDSAGSGSGANQYYSSSMSSSSSSSLRQQKQPRSLQRSSRRERRTERRSCQRDRDRRGGGGVHAPPQPVLGASTSYQSALDASSQGLHGDHHRGSCVDGTRDFRRQRRLNSRNRRAKVDLVSQRHGAEGGSGVPNGSGSGADGSGVSPRYYAFGA